MKKKTLFLFMVILLFSSCQPIEIYRLDSSDFNKQIEDTLSRDVLPFAKGNGINVGLYNTDGNIEQNYNFYINEGEKFEKFISIGNLTDKPLIFKIILLVDYNQSEFSVDDRDPQIDYNFIIASYESIEIPVTLPALSKGLHDILFVIVRYPEEKSLNDEFRAYTDLNHLIFQRFSICVESDTVEKPVLESDINIIDSNIMNGVYLSKTSNLDHWLSEKIKSQEELKYYVNAGNNSSSKEYVLVLLFDWRQIEIYNNKNKLFFSLDQNKLLQKELKYQIPNERGVKDFTAVLIHNPYQICTLYNRTVETCVRVGLDIE